ncbi:ABC transporter permease subunit [Nakamurella flavida]|uniref:ABC transporter permease subunit n=1 Tax=Nakamurella flavida TaxID=363630 RepID=A0A938YS04_9ACTN|nr:ABC transporter permease subunit [Nakamurella flavida]MBM9477820.1 ABC transporter permease subunit [Nakamurella flavida]MDP9779374.1 ABC-type nitrate/sulfonate/bicarbonate transport system permease component [Nakamurella flavida]
MTTTASPVTTGSAPTPASTPAAESTRTPSVVGAAAKRAGVAVVTIVVSLGALCLLWIGLLKLFDVSKFVGKGPGDVWAYLFSAKPAAGIRPASMTAEMARSGAFDALGTTLLDAAIGFVTGLVIALVIAAGFVLLKPFEVAFMPIAMLLRSVPLVAMAPVLLLIFGQGKLGIAAIAAIVVLFPALVNITLGLRSASPQSLDVIRVNGGSPLTALLKVRVPSALPQFLASVRISVPGAIVGAMLAEWLSGFDGLGGVLSTYKGQGNYGGVWTVVVLAVVSSIVLYAVAAVIETAVLAAWGPDAGKR